MLENGSENNRGNRKPIPNGNLVTVQLDTTPGVDGQEASTCDAKVEGSATGTYKSRGVLA